VSYIGNNPVNQNFVAGADQFSGTGSQTVFTLSRNVNTVFDMFVTVSNVPQDPFTAYTVAGNTLTFDSAPPSGTNNIDVVYRATNVQTFVPSPGVSQQFSIGTAASPAITFIGDTNTGIYSPGADTIAFSEGGIEVMRLDSSANLQFNSGYGSVATAYGCRAWVNFNGTGTVAIRASGNVSSITDNGVGDYTANFINALVDGNYCLVAATGANSNPTVNTFVSVQVEMNTLATQTTTSVRFGTGKQYNPFTVSDIAQVNIAIFR
jgi:hypothetical protein